MTKDELTPEEWNKCRDVIKKAEEYSGWPNYETWAAALYLDNDNTAYKAMRQMAKDALENAPQHEYAKPDAVGKWTHCEIARLTMAEKLKDMFESKIPRPITRPEGVDNAIQNTLHDVLTANVQQIDYGKIAEGYLEEELECKK